MMKKDLFRYVGSMQQLAGIRRQEFLEGQAARMKAISVKNGEMNLLIMENKCLDIAELSYRGVNFSFLSKQGIQSPFFTRVDGSSPVQSIMGGLFFTAGFENVGGCYTKEGTYYPLHGSMRLVPAEHISSFAGWSGNEYCLSVSGEIRNAALFGENIVLRRRIQCSLGSRSIEISDEIENESYHNAPWMLLYHFNFGYPLLHPSGNVILPTLQVADRDENNYQKAAYWQNVIPPIAGVPESVYIHELAEDEQGRTFAAYMNPELKLGIKLQYEKQLLPYFIEWKSMAAGDYALGLEPSNVHILGRRYHEERETLPTLKPFEKKNIRLVLTILDGDEDWQQVTKEAEKLIEKKGKLSL